MSTPPSRTLDTQGNGRWSPPPPGTRSAEQIRNDIVQLREHRTQIAVGAAVVGFAVGTVLALRRRG